MGKCKKKHKKKSHTESQAGGRKAAMNRQDSMTDTTPNNKKDPQKKHRLGKVPGRVAQSVTCPATDACLTADPGVASSIQARSHTFVEIDHEIIATVILLPSADSFKKGCCQLQAKVCAQITG